MNREWIVELRDSPGVQAVETLQDAAGFRTVLVVPSGPRSGPDVRAEIASCGLVLDGSWQLVLVPVMPRDEKGELDELAAMRAAERSPYVYRYEAPCGEVEEALAGLLAQMLPNTVISMTDDLAAMGADSMLTIGLVDHLEQHFGVELDPAEVFLMRSLRELAKRVDRTDR